MLELLLFGCLLITGAHAYPYGAPPTACSSMIPQHPGSNTATGDPYSIQLSGTQYSASGSLTVTLMGTASFKGFLVQALLNNGTAIGDFEVLSSSQSGLGQVRCTNGLTHTTAFSSADPLNDRIELKWNAPSTVQGNIIFYTTFVQEVDKFWVKVPSDAVWDGVSPVPTTSKPSVITDPNPLDPLISADECGDTKGCYRDCQGNSCEFLVSWKKDGTTVDFELFGTLEENQGYVALGLSKKDTMEDVSIIACTADDERTSKVEQFYAAGRVTPTPVNIGPINSGDAAVAAVQTATVPKTMSCRFTYDNKIAKGKLAQWKDLDEELYIFVARGAYFSGNLAKHVALPKISPTTLRLADTNYVDVRGTRVNSLIKAHACIMVLAWVFCASVGLILARYYKPMWSDTKACGQKVWFSYHRALMLSAMFLTVIAFIIILVHKKGVFETPPELPTKAHPILGLIAIICALLNPIIAAFRCHPGESKRPIFNWVHWFVGTVAHVFAMSAIVTGSLFVDQVIAPKWLWYVSLGFAAYHVLCVIILELHTRLLLSRHKSSKGDSSYPKPAQPAVNKPKDIPAEVKYEVVAIFLGMLITSVHVPGWITYVMMAFCLFHVCVEFILEIHQCCMYDKNRDRQEEYQMANKDGGGKEPEYAGRGFKCVMLAIYMVVVTCITIALVVIIAVWGSIKGTTA